MKRSFLSLTTVAVALCAAVSLSSPAADAPATSPQFKLLATFPVSGEGKWDYLTVDPDSHRLYLPRSTHTQVIELQKDSVVGDLPDTSGVHGVAVAPENGLGFTSNGKTNDVTVFDLKTLKPVKTIKVGKRPDAIHYDAASKHVFVMNHGGGDITVIDPAALDKETVTIAAAGGALEDVVDDGAGRLYVNSEDKNEIIQVDTKTNKVLAHWSTAPGDGPTGLAIDVKNHRLFAGCGNEKMVVVDSDSGKVVATVAVGKGVDGAAFDDQLGVALCPNGQDGTLSIIKQTAADKFEVIQTVNTIKGARTITYDPKLHRAYLPCNIPDNKGGTTVGIAVVGPEAAK